MNCMRTVSGKLRSRQRRGKRPRRVAPCTLVNDYEQVAPRRPHTRDYDQPARDTLGKAVVRAREEAGYTWSSLMAAAGIGKTSLFNLERGVPVGPKVYEAVARALPGWTVDTPVEILEGRLPAPVAQTADLPEYGPAEPTVYDLPAIYQADHWTLLEILRDPDKLGTDEYFIALGILWADKKIDRETFLLAARVGKRALDARIAEMAAKAQMDREIADLQQSLTERIRPELSG